MNGGTPLDQRYLEWLYSLVGPSHRRYPARYWKLFEQLYSTPFIWFVPNDDNRIEDAREVRLEFMQRIGEENELWYEMEASVLEVLYAMAKRVGYELDESPGQWFWVFIDNLGLSDFEDAHWNVRASRLVKQATDRLINRTYAPNGEGGLFPLKRPPSDQREVEMWHQMSSFVLERF